MPSSLYLKVEMQSSKAILKEHQMPVVNPTEITESMSLIIDDFIINNPQYNPIFCIDFHQLVPDCTLTHPMVVVDSPSGKIIHVLDPNFLGEGTFGLVGELIGTLSKVDGRWQYVPDTQVNKMIIKLFLPPYDEEKKILKENVRTKKFAPNLNCSCLSLNKHPIALIMRKVDGINLEEYTKRYAPYASIQDLLLISKNILRAVYALHQKNMIHRDIKPKNIMINPTTLEITIIDYAFAVSLSEKHKQVCRKGTPFFLSKEIIDAVHDNSHISFKSDTYATGLSLAYLFGDKTMHELERKDIPPSDMLQVIYQRSKNHQFIHLLSTILGLRLTIRHALNTLFINLTEFEPSKRITLVDGMNRIDQIIDLLETPISINEFYFTAEPPPEPPPRPCCYFL
jgi:serine/threonine protein kinase